MCVENSKDYLSIMKGCDNLKLNLNPKSNRNGLTNQVLAASGLKFNFLTEYSKSNNVIILVTKILLQKAFLRIGC